MERNKLSFLNKYGWIIIVVISFLAYLPALSASFLAWDDDIYILNNPMIIGFNLKNIVNIFSNFYYGLYHPLTILSWNIEHSIVGFSPWLFHLNNLLIHLINIYLVYLIFSKYLLKNLDVALIISALFGISTIHVESVTWITERKDVLYTMFYLIAIIQYFNYKKSTKTKHYIFIFIFFILSLLSKGMAITFPIVLILIDYLENKNIFNFKLIAEKIPFFALSLTFGIINILAQKDFFGNKPNIYSLSEQLMFSSYAYIQYILKSIIPYNLSAFYPYPKLVNGSYGLIYPLSIILVIFIIAIIILSIIKNKRKIVFGITFFSVNIIFVLQLFLHNTEAIISDRYPYLGSIGLYFLIALFFIYIKNKYSKYNKFTEYALYLIIIVLAVNTFNRNKIWKNDLTLFSDVLEKHPNAYIAANNIGVYYLNNKDIKNAMKYFTKAIKIKPQFSDAYSNRGTIYFNQNKLDKALSDLNKAAKYDINNSTILQNRGNVYFYKKDYKNALKDYNKALEIAPNKPKTLINRGLLYCQIEQVQKAKTDFDLAKSISKNLSSEITNQIKPYLELYNKKGVYYGKKANYKMAIKYFNMALTLNPDFIDAKQNILYAKKMMKKN